MGACGSKQKENCFGNNKNIARIRKNRRRQNIKKKKKSININCVDFTFQESQYNPATLSDCDEDFHSVQDAFADISQGGTDNESTSTTLSPILFNHILYNHNIPVNNLHIVEPQKNIAEIFEKNIRRENATQVPRIGLQTPVFLDEISTQNESERDLVNSCGLIPNSCLPCLNLTVPSEEKRAPPSPSPPSTRKKSALKITFFGRDENANPSLILSPKALLQRPIAGSQVPRCPLEKALSDSWSPIEPSMFKVRGKNYLRDKKKEFASNIAAFSPFGIDVFVSPRKIDHIARFVELPAYNSFGEVPPILVVNLQIPLYPATIFQSEYNGEGMSYVLYFKLSENYSKELPLHFQQNLKRIIDDEVERERGFPMDTIAPCRERLKILGRVVNIDELHLSAAERKLMSAYNEKPVLSCPQHEFYLGENYLEIDLDSHRFGYIPRKGFEAFQERLKLCVLDFGLTIQGNKAEDLPEQLLCCVRLKEIDYNNYHQLGQF